MYDALVGAQSEPNPVADIFLAYSQSCIVFPKNFAFLLHKKRVSEIESSETLVCIVVPLGFEPRTP